MSTIIQRGALIVLEGCDRCGKTTQGLKLVEKLKQLDIKAEFLRFPDRTTTTGKLISNYLRQSKELEDHAIHLLFSANRWELVAKMKKMISEGTTLVVDRYAFSGVAFSSVKMGMNLDWCKQTDVGLPKPDMVLFLDLSIEAAATRGDYGGERYENKEIQTSVREVFMELKDEDWKIIDADKSIGDLHEELVEISKQVIEDSQDKELGQLWCSTADDKVS